MTRSSAREIAIHIIFSLGFDTRSAREVLDAELTHERFQELGEALKNASYVQAASVKNEKSVMDAAAALTESSRHLQETMDRMMRRQEELTGEISEQGKLLAQACEEISSEVSSQLYTFEQMRTTYED